MLALASGGEYERNKDGINFYSWLAAIGSFVAVVTVNMSHWYFAWKIWCLSSTLPYVLKIQSKEANLTWHRMLNCIIIFSIVIQQAISSALQLYIFREEKNLSNKVLLQTWYLSMDIQLLFDLASLFVLCRAFIQINRLVPLLPAMIIRKNYMIAHVSCYFLFVVSVVCYLVQFYAFGSLYFSISMTCCSISNLFSTIMIVVIFNEICTIQIKMKSQQLQKVEEHTDSDGYAMLTSETSSC